MVILEELEGKDIHIGSYDAGGRHFWLDKLKLPRLQLEWHNIRLKSDQTYIPSVIILHQPSTLPPSEVPERLNAQDNAGLQVLPE